MRPEIVAEFCQNHNGDKTLLSEMVQAAAENGARYGKIQTIFARNLAFRPRFETGCEVDGKTVAIKRPYSDEFERLSGLELDYDAHGAFIELCGKWGLIPVTTCFARECIPDLAALGFKHVKVASYDCASFPMLRELAGAFDTVIVSTGASFDQEIRHAAEVLEGSDYWFLHCVSLYPTPPDQAHINRLEFLSTFTDQIGYSDHSDVRRDGILSSKVAIYTGARMVERHFTILDADRTKDGPVSIGPGHLSELVAFGGMEPAEQLEHLDREHADWRVCLGSSRRRLSDQELLNRDYYRGRFASNRKGYEDNKSAMINNWEETPLDG